MDITERKITKIAREAKKLVLFSLREEGVGPSEIDFIHALRHNPGCTQAKLAEILHTDKAAIARRTNNFLCVRPPLMTGAASCFILLKRQKL